MITFENVASRASTRFSIDLARWTSFWYQLTQFYTRPRNHQDKHFEQYLWWLLKKCDLWSVNSFLPIWPGHLVFDSMWPSFKLDLEIIKTNIWSKIHDDCCKNVTGRVVTRFSADLARWPIFYPKRPSFKLDLEIIKTIMLSKIHDYYLENVTTRVLTWFSADLARWPSFLPQVTQFRTWPKNHQDKYFEQNSW